MKKIECISPIDGKLLASRDTTSNEALANIVAEAKRAQKEWAKTPLATRKEYMKKFMAAMQSMNQEIIPELAQQMGRPVRFGGEWRGFDERMQFMLQYADQALSDRSAPDPKEGFVRFQAREPVGVVMVIAPWNYPYLTANSTISVALLSGNAVILKHSAQTILVGERFQKAFDMAGLPNGLFSNVVLDHGQTEKLLGSGDINFVNFTGSVGGGRAIEKAAAGSFAGVGLELGGKDPAYVMENADIKAAIDGLVDGAFFNSGQCCCGIERIYVHEKVYDEFLSGAIELTKKYVLDNPLDEKTTLGPMANIRFAKTVRDQVAAAIKDGAKPHIDPKLFPKDNGKDCYVAPQILTDVNHDMVVMREETFGPVVGIMKVKSDAEAVQLMNDSQFGLTVSLWTNDVERATTIGRQLDTGTVFMNRCDYVDPGLGWTGTKETGRGISLGFGGFDSVTRPKNFHLKKL
ncbi:MAG: aldehyde dehydrogenase family protein [Hydrotalea sp.]|nr:aldehyde dehydrogenase family protein [Hydrotalea sp.]